MPRRQGRTLDDYDTLVDVITGTIQPTTWDQVGGSDDQRRRPWLGEGSIVSQSQDVHQQIIDLLEQIRAVAAKNPDAGPPRRDRQKPPIEGCFLPAH